MQTILDVIILFSAISHILFLLLEMVYWDKPLGLKVFRLQPEFARVSRALAMNQGLYNGFLAAGLFWSLWSGLFSLQLFFLSCVFIAGVFGALTVNKRIFWVQGFPAMLGLLLLFQLV